MFKKRNIPNLITPCSNSLLGLHQTPVVFILSTERWQLASRDGSKELVTSVKLALASRGAAAKPNNLGSALILSLKIVIWCKMLPPGRRSCRLVPSVCRVSTVTLSTAARENSEQTDSIFTIFCHFCIWPKATDV